MERYVLLEKVGSTPCCSYYHAENSLTRQPLTLKKLKTQHEWEKLLNCKEIALMKDTSNRHLTRLLEIIRHKHHFYLVHPRLGDNLQMIFGGRPFETKDIVVIAEQMLEALFELIKCNYTVDDLRLEMYFLDGRHVKLGIIPVPEGAKNIDYRYFAPERLTTRQQTQKSLVFSLGCIMIELLTGQQLIDAKNRKEYVSQLNNLNPEEQLQSVFNDLTTKNLAKSLPRLLKDCDFTPLTDLMKMMTRLNPHERISLEEVHVRLRYFHSKLTESTKRSKSKLEGTKSHLLPKICLTPLEATLPKLPQKAIKTQANEEKTPSPMVQTRSYRLHRSLKKMKRNPQKHSYDHPYGFSPRACCAYKLKHRDIAKSKLTHYACSDMRSSISGHSEHDYD